MELFESEVIGKGNTASTLLPGKSERLVLCTFGMPTLLWLPLLHGCESIRGYWHTNSCRVVAEDSYLFTHFNRDFWKHLISHTHCHTGILHRFFSSLMNDSWKWRWREENAMKLQYCSELGSRWQTFLQQYTGLTLRLPWLLLACLICLSLMLCQCDAFLQGNTIKMCGFRHSMLSGELSSISVNPFRAN